MMMTPLYALVQLGNSNSEVVTALFALLNNDTSIIRNRTAKALGQLAKNSDKILPAVVGWLKESGDIEVMDGAIDCLWSIVVE
jgi:hypothetical protein